MPNVYTKEYLAKHEVIEETFEYPDHSYPSLVWDAQVRELRNWGFNVECCKSSYIDYARIRRTTCWLKAVRLWPKIHRARVQVIA